MPSRVAAASVVQDQLRDVQQIQSGVSAFAAILSDGFVVTWGDAKYGADSSAVQDQLRDVRQIQAFAYAFAAIRSDGSVCGHLGLFPMGRRQPCRTGSVARCAADPSLCRSICGNPG